MSRSKGRLLKKEDASAVPNTVEVATVNTNRRMWSHSLSRHREAAALELERPSQVSELNDGFRARRQSRLGSSAKRFVLLQRLQFLAGLKANCLAGRDGDFRAGSRVAPNAGLSRAHIEDAKTAEFDPIAVAQRFLHGFKDGFDCHLSLGLGDPRAIDHLVDDVELNQAASFGRTWPLVGSANRSNVNDNRRVIRLLTGSSGIFCPVRLIFQLRTQDAGRSGP